MSALSVTRLVVSTALVVGGTLAAPALAGFTQPYTPPWRGAPNTEFGGWESFTSAVGGVNLPDDVNSNTLDAEFVQLDPSAFLTSGNIYSFSTPLDCRLTNTVPLDALRVALQTSTKGSELDYASVSLSYVDGLGATQTLPWTSHTELANIPGMGAAVESLFEWELTGITDSITSFEIDFQGAQASVSLDAVVLDVQHAAAPVAYCTAKTNSAGCAPSIGWSGLPSASLPSGFAITASNVLNNKNGLFFYSTHGRIALPFQGGTLCAKAPIKRTAVQNSAGTPPPNNCSGTFTFDFNAHIASGVDPALVSGALVDGQYWHRDPGFAPPNNTGLTNAIEFVIP